MPTVYQLEGLARKISDLIDDLGDDDDDAEQMAAIEAVISQYEGDAMSKVDALAHVIHAMTDHLSIARSDAERAAAAVRYWTRERGRVRELAKRLVVAHRDLTGESSIKGVRATMSLTSRSSFVYPPEADWPPELCETVVRPNRTAAAEAIRAGTAPKGFGRTEAEGLTVRGRK